MNDLYWVRTSDPLPVKGESCILVHYLELPIVTANPYVSRGLRFFVFFSNYKLFLFILSLLPYGCHGGGH